jgi:hypothetical protein
MLRGNIGSGRLGGTRVISTFEPSTRRLDCNAVRLSFAKTSSESLGRLRRLTFRRPEGDGKET